MNFIVVGCGRGRHGTIRLQLGELVVRRSARRGADRADHAGVVFDFKSDLEPAPIRTRGALRDYARNRGAGVFRSQ